MACRIGCSAASYILSNLAAGSGFLCTQAVSLITSELGCQLCLHTRAVNKEFQRVLKTLSTPCIALNILYVIAVLDGCLWQRGWTIWTVWKIEDNRTVLERYFYVELPYIAYVKYSCPFSKSPGFSRERDIMRAKQVQSSAISWGFRGGLYFFFTSKCAQDNVGEKKSGLPRKISQNGSIMCFARIKK